MHIYRTHTCNELRETHAGQVVRLSGWVFRKRDHGGILFIDLRDHYGLTQIVVHPSRTFFDELTKLRLESVIIVEGIVTRREPTTVNPDLPSGAVEVVPDVCTVRIGRRADPHLFAGGRGLRRGAAAEVPVSRPAPGVAPCQHRAPLAGDRSFAPDDDD